MEIVLFDSLPSTQVFLLQAIAEQTLSAPVAIMTKEQTFGIGSRDNDWSGEEGNFFASFAIPLKDLPEDMPLSSASIYFAYLMKKVLLDFEPDVWIKWPNDIYIENEKIGGVITKKVEDILVCGIGTNLKNSQNSYRALQSDISPELLLNNYLKALEKYPKWKQIFSEYRVEFERSKKFSVHIENYEKSLSDAVLCDDGSLLLEGRKVYSLR